MVVGEEEGELTHRSSADVKVQGGDGNSKRVCRSLPCSVECWRTGIPPAWLVLSALLVIQLGFGLYPVVVKKFASEKQANPLIFSFYRDMCCVPLLFLCALIAERKLLFPNKKMLLVFAVFGLVGMLGNQLLYILGVYWVGPAIAGAVQPITPVWAAILAVTTCTEKIPSPLHVHSWAKVIGILMATGGAIEIALTAPKEDTPVVNATLIRNATTTSHHHHVSKQILGYVALLGGTFCSALYLILQKRLIFNKQYNRWKKYPIYVTAYGYFFGALFMGLGSVCYVAVSGKYSDFKIPQDSAYALVYAIFIASALCYMLITWTNLHLSTTTVTAFWPVQILIAVVASYVITGDQLAIYQYIGAVMLMVALLLVLFSDYMEERLRDGRSVLRVDCRRAAKQQQQQLVGAIGNERSRLLISEGQDSTTQYGVN